MTLHIKPATNADIQKLPDICYATIRRCYPTIIGADTVETYTKSGAVPSYFSQNKDTTLCLYSDDQLIGAGTYRDNRVDLMMIHHQMHRSGAGSRLLAALEDILLKTHKRLTLDCFTNNLQAMNFYQKHGWKPVRQFQDEYDIHYTVLEKSTPPA
ncbi:hypothetical protein GCM10017044_13890 [Kordiimonas sediminis]|uniref:N-acetyltransferase domain-containing protein n=1 Tax=Kordiimonas sediminis TaxID=1735581 RepID=A0A919E7K1_9PROT|nr:GNAT family N-acetyltransferase [Kordiimonas sediminis]GHF20283.1 hypothetical protein GCM10017044_13890 [Kordiimonas sediminis]